LNIVRGEPVSNDSQIAKGYRFFERKLKTPGVDNLEKLKQVIVNNLVLVSIVLDRDDNYPTTRRSSGRTSGSGLEILLQRPDGIAHLAARRHGHIAKRSDNHGAAVYRFIVA